MKVAPSTPRPRFNGRCAGLDPAFVPDALAAALYLNDDASGRHAVYLGLGPDISASAITLARKDVSLPTAYFLGGWTGFPCALVDGDGVDQGGFETPPGWALGEDDWSPAATNNVLVAQLASGAFASDLPAKGDDRAVFINGVVP